MDKKTLIEANRLNKLIEEHEEALRCFEYNKNECINYYREANGEEVLPPEFESTNPKLIIEFDEYDEGELARRKLSIPMVLSDFLVDVLKKQIKNNLDKLKSDFNKL